MLVIPFNWQDVLSVVEPHCPQSYLLVGPVHPICLGLRRKSEFSSCAPRAENLFVESIALWGLETTFSPFTATAFLDQRVSHALP